MKNTILLTMTALVSVGSSSAAVWIADAGTFEHSTATDSIAATLDGAAVTFTSDVAGAFKTGSTNAELTRVDENEVGSIINYTFSSTTGTGFDDFTLLVHNMVNDQRGSGSNFISNFSVTYADGSTATPTIAIANIGSTSEFDISGIDGQPNGLASAFDTSQILVDTSGSLVTPTTGNPQGSGLVTFGSSIANGGITDVSFTWNGNSIRGNTAFLGFSGTAVAVPVPEPSSTALLGLSGLALLARRRR